MSDGVTLMDEIGDATVNTVFPALFDAGVLWKEEVDCTESYSPRREFLELRSKAANQQMEG